MFRLSQKYMSETWKETMWRLCKRVEYKQKNIKKGYMKYIKIYTNSSTIPTFPANDCYYSPFALVYTNDNIQNQRLAQNAQT